MSNNSMMHPLIKIGMIRIQSPEVTRVWRIPNSNDYGFLGVAQGEEGIMIVDNMKVTKGKLLPCEAITNDGKHISGKGKLKKFESKVSNHAPLTYTFSGMVAIKE